MCVFQFSIKGSLKSMIVEETSLWGRFKVSALLLAVAGVDGVLKEQSRHPILEKMFSFAV